MLRSFLVLVVVAVGCGSRVEDGAAKPDSANTTPVGSPTSAPSEFADSAPPSTSPPGPSNPSASPDAGPESARSSSCTAVGTFDCGDESIARALCDAKHEHGDACVVCVQTVTADGTAVAWSAIDMDSSCPCPPVEVRPGVDAGDGAGSGSGPWFSDGGRDADYE